MAVVRSAIDAADAGHLVRHALRDPDIAARLTAADGVHLIAVGKAAAPMAQAYASSARPATRSALTVGVGEAGHPVPDERSVRAATSALDLAARVESREVLLVLLSGGASALMALPADGLTLDDKQRTVRRLLAGGADIGELNTVRKHLSRIKGGRLAAACRGTTLTLAVSDVVGNDLSVIGSGPTVPDPSTWQSALDVLERRGGRHAYPEAAVSALERGAAGEHAESPKPGDPRIARSYARVIGGRLQAVEGARRAAISLGFHVHVIAEPVIGIAREAADAYAAMLRRLVNDLPRPACIVSAGETTVHVTGRGTGGRNQEFALALVRHLAALANPITIACAGTDGIDGPTDAAGAIVDAQTAARAAAAGLRPDAYLDDNNSHAFFDSLNDLIRTGPTNTNVGDVQVVLVGE